MDTVFLRTDKNQKHGNHSDIQTVKTSTVTYT